MSKGTDTLLCMQRLLGHNSITSLDDQAGSLPLAHRQDPAVASSLHGNGSYRFGVCLALHSSPPERMTQAGEEELYPLKICTHV